MLALVKKVIDFTKYLTNRDINGIVTTASAWLAGVVAVVLYAQTDFASQIDIGGSLAKMNAYSLIAIGLSVGSGAGLAADYLSAKRPSDDPARLKMIPGATVRGKKTPNEDGHLDWQTALLATACAIIVYLVMAKVFKV
jgi:hypothetical protein